MKEVVSSLVVSGAKWFASSEMEESDSASVVPLIPLTPEDGAATSFCELSSASSTSCLRRMLPGVLLLAALDALAGAAALIVCVCAAWFGQGLFTVAVLGCFTVLILELFL